MDISIWIIIFVVTAVFFVIPRLRCNAQCDHVLKQQAVKRKGATYKRGLVGNLKLKFYFEGIPILVYYTLGERPCTYVDAQISPVENINIKVYPKAGMSCMIKESDVKHMGISHNDFIQYFTIEANEETPIRSILSPDVEKKLFLNIKNNPELFFNKKGFRVKMFSLFNNNYQCDSIIDAALEIFKRIRQQS